MFSRLPNAILSIKFFSKHRLILRQEKFEKAWRQDTTRVLVILSRVLFKCATAATLCATLAVHARHPFPVSAHVRCRLEKYSSFSFCQVDMYAKGNRSTEE